MNVVSHLTVIAASLMQHPHVSVGPTPLPLKHKSVAVSLSIATQTGAFSTVRIVLKSHSG